MWNRRAKDARSGGVWIRKEGVAGVERLCRAIIPTKLRIGRERTETMFAESGGHCLSM